jgi:hypothetical protein
LMWAIRSAALPMEMVEIPASSAIR